MRSHLSARHALEEGGEALVEPGVRPPVQGDQVAGPLVAQLVADDGGDALFLSRRARRVGDEVRLPVAEQSRAEQSGFKPEML